MNRDTQQPEQPAEPDTVTITLPEETPDWNDSTIHLQRMHEALVARGWGRGPI